MAHHHEARNRHERGESYVGPIQTAFNTYVCAEEGQIVGNREAAGEWEQWEIRSMGNKIALFSLARGKFLCATPDGNLEYRDQVGDWERWTLEKHGDRFAFRSVHNRFLCCDEGQGKRLVANRPNVGGWESFRINGLTPAHFNRLAGGRVLTGPYHGPIHTGVGTLLCGEPARVIADRKNQGDWEVWDVNPTDQTHVTIHSPAHRKFLSAQPNGSVEYRDSVGGAWEVWTIEKHGDKVAFKSAHGKYLCAQDQGSGFTVVANRDNVGGWESFTLNIQHDLNNLPNGEVNCVVM